MYVTLLFDIEDLVDPRSDDVVLRVAEIFAQEDAPGTMMIVGEKARLWERRGRRDLIEAMGPHDVGLHTNYHSVHPTVAEYLEGKGWEEGVEEVVRRERSGVEDLTRILGRQPSCWGRAGSTWGPQVAPALRRLGVPSMMYSYTHLADARHHVHRFCGTLSYYWYFGGYDQAFCDDEAYARVWEEILTHLAREATGGVPWLGLFVCHPVTVRAQAFWDFLNYNRGMNTPEAEWRMPPYRGEEEWQRAQRNLRRFARDIQGVPGVQLKTVREMNELVAPEPTVVQSSDLLDAARQAAAEGDIRAHGGLMSPAEALYLWAVWLNSGRPEGSLPSRYVEGPIEEPPQLPVPAEVESGQVVAAAAAVVHSVEESGRLPAHVRVGQLDVGIGTLYRALARLRLHPSADRVELLPGPQVPAVGETLAQEVREGIPGWMHKPDLDVSTHAAYTRLQSWTLKPVALR